MLTETRLQPIGPKKLLAIDGGGIRGVLSLEILERIEDTLRAESIQPATFRLSDYFDYIAGTSTGGIIAAGLSTGMSVDEIMRSTSMRVRKCREGKPAQTLALEVRGRAAGEYAEESVWRRYDARFRQA